MVQDSHVFAGRRQPRPCRAEDAAAQRSSRLRQGRSVCDATRDRLQYWSVFRWVWGGILRVRCLFARRDRTETSLQRCGHERQGSAGAEQLRSSVHVVVFRGKQDALKQFFIRCQGCDGHEQCRGGIVVIRRDEPYKLRPNDSAAARCAMLMVLPVHVARPHRKELRLQMCLPMPGSPSCAFNRSSRADEATRYSLNAAPTAHRAAGVHEPKPAMLSAVRRDGP